MRRTDRAALLPVALERSSDKPMHRQLYDQLREMILSGRLVGGERLPSTRTLAKDLAVSRNTVAAAFDQLLAEGYLEGKVGAGSFVSGELPEEALATKGKIVDRDGATPRRRGLSKRGQRLASLRQPRGRRSPAFSVGMPDVADFPFDVWSRLMSKAWRRPPIDLLANAEPAGYLPLREAIAGYLRTARAVRCDAEQVIIVSGAQQAIGLAAHVLLDDGDPVLVEEPGYPGVRGALMAAGAELIPVPVDDEGFDVDAGERMAPEARLACVAPSHQFPLSVTMTLARRLKLLEWASRGDGWVIEDDYDSEYRYGGRPLAALQGLDRDGRVVYVGSFSKVMFPSLRLGYLVVPPDLTEPFRAARAALDDHPSTIAQPALATFIEEGFFAAHLRRTRKLYSQRQEKLLSVLQARVGHLLDVAPSEAGMHVMARFRPELAARMTDVEAVERARDKGLSLSCLSSYYAASNGHQGLLLGYAAVPEEQMAEAVDRLARVLEA
ncbi:MocR-like pyridoxine biosynthesis transcription factor PdxR [Aestuariispira ectoiniformans]|uniref:MocR-like pyridoxine biosynthesis transcription factor PdxR n=1 Tax=Aestuariispira ectoiniformans TaxID=2775080 RepID=UPI00223ABFCE|nr:PLP-dependent aminotransferase family protein [Aestuariispira ectoiniformans]